MLMPAPAPVTVTVPLAAGVSAIFTTRLGGASTGDYATLNLGGKGGDNPAAVAANRRAVERVVGAPVALISQVHSGRAVPAPGSGEPVPQADGQVTRDPGVALGIFAADCLPVLLADVQRRVLGVAHCGRRGLQRGVVAATVDLMVASGARRDAIVAMLGPCICGDCYEVGDAIATDFSKQFPGTDTVTRFGGAGIDIAAAARAALAHAGVHTLTSAAQAVAQAAREQVNNAALAELCRGDNEGDPSASARLAAMRHSLCTLENPLWYSHRRAFLAGKVHEGRMLAVIRTSASR